MSADVRLGFYARASLGVQEQVPVLDLVRYPRPTPFLVSQSNTRSARARDGLLHLSQCLCHVVALLYLSVVFATSRPWAVLAFVFQVRPPVFATPVRDAHSPSLLCACTVGPSELGSMFAKIDSRGVCDETGCTGKRWNGRSIRWQAHVLHGRPAVQNAAARIARVQDCSAAAWLVDASRGRVQLFPARRARLACTRTATRTASRVARARACWPRMALTSWMQHQSLSRCKASRASPSARTRASSAALTSQPQQLVAHAQRGVLALEQPRGELELIAVRVDRGLARRVTRAEVDDFRRAARRRRRRRPPPAAGLFASAATRAAPASAWRGGERRPRPRRGRARVGAPRRQDLPGK